MDNRPSFSIIIPLYNKERSIGRTIQSILVQESVYEIVIVDDGSTDGSVPIVESFDDPRVRLFRQANQGPSAARNLGIQNAKHNWCLFLDADDELTSDALPLFVRMIERYPSVRIFSGAYRNDDEAVLKYKETRLVKNGPKAFVVDWFMLLAGAFICRTDLCRQTLYDERMWRLEDVDFMLRAFRPHEPFVFFPDLVVNRYSEFAEASRNRRPIEKDFRGYLSLKKKSFWEKVAVYRLYKFTLKEYPVEAEILYSSFKRRYDLKAALVLVTYYREWRSHHAR